MAYSPFGMQIKVTVTKCRFSFALNPKDKKDINTEKITNKLNFGRDLYFTVLNVPLNSFVEFYF